MCSSSSVIMPADFEMLVSHSPPVYNNYLADYTPSLYNRDFSKFARNTCRSASVNSFLLGPKLNQNTTTITPKPTIPKRPCLVIRPEDSTSLPSDDDPTSPTRLKKKVVFADDRGMSLTHVRIMTEPSNIPPLLSSRFLSEVTQGLRAEPVAKTEPWEITFVQPASDYLEFRRKLETAKVSLENVIVKEAEDSIVGTVKVSNIAFEKEVFVRSSSDSWKTHEDAFGKFIPNSSVNVNVLFDTFSFKIALPPKARRTEFCVCFKCDSREYWDNNNSLNYVLIRKVTQEPMHLNQNNRFFGLGNQERQANNAIATKSWSNNGFSGWNQDSSSSPYW